MASPEAIQAFALSLLTQGIGGLFLVLICYLLYRHRRRSYFHIWTLSWLFFSLWVLSRALFLIGPLGFTTESAPQWSSLANVGGWLHGALWVLGLWFFFRDPSVSPPDESARALTSPVSAVAITMGVAALGGIVSTFLSWALQNFLLAGALAVVYAGSAVGVVLIRLRRPRLGRLLLGGALALSALAQIFLARRFLAIAHSGSGPQLLPVYMPFLDFLLQTFNAIGMILVLLGQEETLLQQTLRRLAESEDRFRILFEHGGVGLALLSAEGSIVQANPTLEEMLGYGPGQLCGLQLSNLSHPEDRSDDTRRIRRKPVTANRDQTEREKRFLRKDGGVIWARVVRAVVRDEGGAVRYLASVLMNITEQRRAEESLRRAEEVIRRERDFVSLMLQTADALVIVVDHDGRVVRFNPKCAVVSGYSEAEAHGRVFWEFLLPERFVPLVREAFTRVVEPDAAPKAAVPVEVPWRTRTGGERLIAWRQSLVRDEGGLVNYVIGVGLDVTEQRRLEEQLRRTQKLETLATLVGGIAHDFNNQLTVVIGNLNLALEDLRSDGAIGTPLNEPTPANLRALIGGAEEAAQHCADITARLLTFSRGRIGLRQELRLNELLPEAIRLLRSELPPSVKVVFEAMDDAWPIHGDWAQLHQVVHALALNARDAMPGGGVLTLALGNRTVDAEEETVELEARAGRFIELVIQDNGAGMTPEVRARLFEPFFTTKPTGQGSGLSLSEVYGVVKGHQGWIEVETEPGQGSTFHLYFPAADEAPPDAPVPSPPAQGKGECVLVVDDEDMVRDLARVVLERHGLRVLVAADGDEALAQYGAHRGAIDLVLLDYSLPGMTGLQVFEALRKIDPQVCVVFASGYALEGDASPLLAAGGRAFIAKPYRPNELLQVVRKVLDEKTARH
jgi:PAS domain S-box-containing protein